MAGITFSSPLFAPEEETEMDEQMFIDPNSSVVFSDDEKIVLFPFRDIDPLVYREMVETDDAIELASHIKGTLISLFLGDYMHEDERIQDFVREVLERTETSMIELFKLIVRDLLVFGMHVSEIVWYEENSKLYIRRFVLLNPENSGIVYSRENAEFLGVYYNVLLPYNLDNTVVQFGQSQGMRTVFLPEPKVLFVRNAEQIPLARRLYWAWQLKRGAIRYYAKALEKHGAPWVIGKSMNPEELITYLRDLLSLGSVAIRPDETIELLQPKNLAGEAFENAILLADRAIFRMFNIPQLLLTGDTGGSYSLGRQLYEMLMTLLQPEVEQFGKLLVETLAKKIIKLNFNTDTLEKKYQKPYGEFPRKEKLSPDDTFKLTQVLYQLLNTGVLSPEKDGEWIRRKLDLPEGSSVMTPKEE